jgi:N-acetylglucosamine-6-sulfatase
MNIGHDGKLSSIWRGSVARRRWLAAAVALVVAGAAISLVVTRWSKGKSVEGLPTIVLILTDDQRWDSLDAMPTVRSQLAAHGVEFTNSFVVDPLCCPSRASTLTGRYPQSTGVWQNKGKLGGFKSFHQDGSTLATWLHDRGYHTALFGKYLNRYENTSYIPPGWERWVAFDGSVDRGDLYFDYTLNMDGRLTRYGRGPDDYSTDVLADQAVGYIRDTGGPLLLYFAPYAPHAPSTPAPGDQGLVAGVHRTLPPNFNEADMSDKSAWARTLRPLSGRRLARVDRRYRDTLASLHAVDVAVGQIVQALAATGRLEHSMIVFTSDNGFSFGEHRWVDKQAPWEESIRVPLVVRYDAAITTPRRDAHLVQSLDLAPTFADLAGVDAPGAAGRSLLPLLLGSRTSWRNDLLVEAMGKSKRGVPTYCAVRDATWKLIAYATGDLELYDMEADPYELQNLAGDPGLTGRITQMKARLRKLCDPAPPRAPPGFPP